MLTYIKMEDWLQTGLCDAASGRLPSIWAGTRGPEVFWCHRGPVGNPSRGSVRELSRLIGLTQLDFGESYFGLLFTPICGDLAFIVSSQENVMQHHTG